MKVIRKDISTGRGVFLNPSDLSPIFDRLRAQSAEPMAAGVLGPDFLVISTEPTVSHAEIAALAGVDFVEFSSEDLSAGAGHAALTLTERHVFVDLWFRNDDLAGGLDDEAAARVRAFLVNIEGDRRLVRAYRDGFSASVIIWSRDGEHMWTCERGEFSAAALPNGPLPMAAAR